MAKGAEEQEVRAVKQWGARSWWTLEGLRNYTSEMGAFGGCSVEAGCDHRYIDLDVGVDDFNDK